MYFLNSLILDLVVVLIFVSFAVIGFRSGAFKSFCGFAGSIFASILSVFVGEKISFMVYNNLILPYLKDIVNDLVLRCGSEGFDVLDEVPYIFAVFLKNRGITSTVLSHIMNNNASSVVSRKIVQLLESSIRSSVKSGMVFVSFLVLSRFVKFCLKRIFKFFRSTALKGASEILGGVFGLLKGYIVVAVCMCCIKTIVVHIDVVPKIFSDDSISGSIVFKELYNRNPIYDFLSNI